MTDVLVEKVMYECPMCDETHLVEKRKRLVKTKIKGEVIEYYENYYRCQMSNESYDFVPGKMMDENLLRARNAYRQLHKMLTSHEIIAIRKKYGLTQKEFALMLGWGEVTVARYETKLIQDEAHDDIMKAVSCDAMEARKYLERNKNAFTSERYTQILSRIDAEINRTSVEYYTKKKIKAQYVRFSGNADATGGVPLNIEKVQNMIAFFANNCHDLFKVKLMKLLWYSDALCYQRHGHAISGLVYQHMPKGALPVANWDFMELVPIETIVDEHSQYDSYKILPSDNFNEDVFSEDEKSVLYAVLNKFKNFTGGEIANYMHDEIAYTQTQDRDIIPFSLAEHIRHF